MSKQHPELTRAWGGDILLEAETLLTDAYAQRTQAAKVKRSAVQRLCLAEIIFESFPYFGDGFDVDDSIVTKLGRLLPALRRTIVSESGGVCVVDVTHLVAVEDRTVQRLADLMRRDGDLCRDCLTLAYQVFEVGQSAQWDPYELVYDCAVMLRIAPAYDGHVAVSREQWR